MVLGSAKKRSKRRITTTQRGVMTKIAFVLLYLIFSCSLVFAKVPYDVQNLTPEYIFEKYGWVVEDIHCLFYPAQKPKHLIVIFSPTENEKYNMWSWFFCKSEYWRHVAYLYINDPSNYFYVGKKENSTNKKYKKIIDHFLRLCELSYQDVVALGTVMCAYGALYYALKLGFKGAVIHCPVMHFNNELYNENLKKTGFKAKIIARMIKQTDKIPYLYLQFYEEDDNGRKDAQSIIKEYKHKEGGFLIVNEINTHFPRPKKQLFNRRTVPVVLEMFGVTN